MSKSKHFSRSNKGQKGSMKKRKAVNSAKGKIIRWFTNKDKSISQKQSETTSQPNGDEISDHLKPFQQSHTVGSSPLSQQSHDTSISLIANMTEEEKEFRSCMSVFDLVFYVPLRLAHHGASSVVDLVCDSVSSDQNTKQKITQMLRDDSIPCLLILDGLDECRVERFPENEGLKNCVVMFTMRPWRLITLRLGLDRDHDKVVKIMGLKKESVEKVFNNVLVNFYGLKLASSSYLNKFKRFCLNAKLPIMRSLITIPLMASAACLVWNEEDDVSLESDQGISYFITLFYLKLVELLIARGEGKYNGVRDFLMEMRQRPNTSKNLPDTLAEFSHIIDFFGVIKQIGQLTLQDLMSEETYLVFPKDKIERDIGQSTVELALQVGILTQTKAPCLSYQRRVCVSFFHKTVQELVAALSIVCGDSITFTSFCTHCDTVEKVLSMSNVIMFVCGLNPSVGCKLSEHVRAISDNDADIIQYRRKTLSRTLYVFSVVSKGEDKVEELCNMQYKWYNEMKQNLSFTHNADHELAFDVSDVHLDTHCDQDQVSMFSAVMSRENNNIVSVCLKDLRSNSNKSVIKHLPICKHLKSLYTLGIEIDKLESVLPHLVHLEHIVLGLRPFVDSSSLCAL